MLLTGVEEEKMEDVSEDIEKQATQLIGGNISYTLEDGEKLNAEYPNRFGYLQRRRGMASKRMI